MPASPASISHAFTALDWTIVIGYFALSTWIGAKLAGRQATIREFFLGGRKLPWYAVAGSIVATEISAVTFVSLPFVVFRPGGDLTYLQLGLFGSVLARIIVAWVLVPAYYRREIYSPYDFVGDRLGEPARKAATVLFTLGGALAQSARVYMTAVVLELVLYDTVFTRLEAATGVTTMTWAIWTIGLVAVVWTLLGGIATVIWTDVLLFVVFLGGAVAALAYVVSSLDGGAAELMHAGQEAGKFRFFDFRPTLFEPYTFWAAIIANTWHSVGAFGTDQMMTQRMFCCRGVPQARRAVLASCAGLVVTITVMLVGVGLFAYYRAHPLSGDALTLYNEDGNRIFPIFIIQQLPPGLTGLLIAAILAAAVSSLDSILAALSQTTLSTFYLPWRAARSAGVDAAGPESDRHAVLVSRALVVVWGVVLCLLAQLSAVAAAHFRSILDLALSMAGYTGGALIAAFFLALLPVRADWSGFCWAAPISVLAVFAVAWHQPFAQVTCWVAAGVVLLLWLAVERPGRGTRGTDLNRAAAITSWLRRTLALLAALALILVLEHYGYKVSTTKDGMPAYVTIAWPWWSPIGGTLTFVWSLLLRRAVQT